MDFFYYHPKAKKSSNLLEHIMRILLPLLFILFMNFLISADSTAQDLPLVYEVENTCEECSQPPLPSVENLPRINALPNPFEWSDGSGVISKFSDWKYRRAEIGAEIEKYEIGQKPVKPDTIEASYSDSTLTVHVTVDGETLTLTSPIILPEGDGPFPLIIGMGRPSGSLPEDIFSSRDIAQMGFNFEQVMAHSQTRGSEPINKLYPELTDVGAYAAWPWGISRLIDGLELVSDDLNIDMQRMGVTGCSFAGKMALFSGAFDERIALTISQESGGGGYTSWRFSDTMSEVETLSKTNAAWFRAGFIQNFGNSVNKLPFDHHELMAMVAPRALLVLGNPDYVWMADESGYVASKAAEMVWEALGISDRFGYSIVGGHPHCILPESQVPEVEAYIEQFLLGNESADTDVAVSPYETDLSPWINWGTPEL